MVERKVLRGIRSEWRAAEQTPQSKKKIKPEQIKETGEGEGYDEEKVIGNGFVSNNGTWHGRMRSR